ncbi:type II toxin-antitoxin system VapC family toxin [Enterovirga rhinocerotis]|uniref:PIN domain-containing protein n=1 Tax=Enterovirga rhinocerotis TaxID=1339210 RepID=A0A4R7C691_9HYPH|nr:type II toxin-antitoxin system VapC family toxin [Enterovirga rhinocerotis]TDR93633.1 hypothetical protein EV668_0898 [Enterovirga rhinocerotis]
MTFFDTNVVLDVLTDDPAWADWSTRAIAGAEKPRRVSPVVFAELAASFASLAALERELAWMDMVVEGPSPQALFAAGQAHAAYRRRGGPRDRVLADFLIGAQAAEQGAALVTRDAKRYRTAFPDLMLTAP